MRRINPSLLDFERMVSSSSRRLSQNQLQDKADKPDARLQAARVKTNLRS